MASRTCPAWCSGSIGRHHEPDDDGAVIHRVTMNRSEFAVMTFEQVRHGATGCSLEHEFGELEVQVEIRDEPPLTVEETRQSLTEIAAMMAEGAGR